METKTYYYAGKPTGSTIGDTSRPEIGNSCGHKHKSYEAAQKCAAAQEAPGFREWRVYEARQ